MVGTVQLIVSHTVINVDETWSDWNMSTSTCPHPHPHDFNRNRLFSEPQCQCHTKCMINCQIWQNVKTWNAITNQTTQTRGEQVCFKTKKGKSKNKNMTVKNSCYTSWDIENSLNCFFVGIHLVKNNVLMCPFKSSVYFAIIYIL